MISAVSQNNKDYAQIGHIRKSDNGSKAQFLKWRWRNGVSEVWSDLPKVTEPGSIGLGL